MTNDDAQKIQAISIDVPLAPTPLDDAALIAAAPDLLARLCDEVERLRALVPVAP